MGEYIIKRKLPDLRKLLGEASRDGDIVKEPCCPKRAGPAFFRSSFSVMAGKTNEESIVAVTEVRMPGWPLHNDKDEWYEMVDELEGELLAICDGTVMLNDILGHFTAIPEDEEREVDEYEKADSFSQSQALMENLIKRLVRLYEFTFISW